MEKTILINNKIQDIAMKCIDLDEMSKEETIEFVEQLTSLWEDLMQIDDEKIFEIGNKIGIFTESLGEKIEPFDDDQIEEISSLLENLGYAIKDFKLKEEFSEENDFEVEETQSEKKSDIKLETEDKDGSKTDEKKTLNDQLKLDEDEEFLKDYLDEMTELIKELEQQVINISSNPNNLEIINNIFRLFHTIKGNAGIMEHSKLRELAHKAEDILDFIRANKISVSKNVIKAIINTNDILSHVVNSLPKNNFKEDLADKKFSDFRAYLINVKDEEVNAFEDGKTATPKITDLALSKSEFDADSFIEDLQDNSSDNKSSNNLSIRISVEKMDLLLNIVSELIISSNLIREHDSIKNIKNIEFLKEVSRNYQIISQLQKMTLSLRMISIESIFTKMKRVVFDYIRNEDKDINLIIQHNDTEIDRNIVSKLYEPLTHLVRNSCDHGIEDNETRQKLGKPLIGMIKLTAFHKGDNVIIEIEDDGKGLDRELIIEHAKNKNLDFDARASDKEIYNLILQPGFSTAEKVTKLSGRGVGMDVVNKTVSTLGGKIEITSEKGKYTKFSIKLPLTLAIIEGMLVKCGDLILVIPVASIQRLIKPESKDLEKVFGKGELLRIKDKLFPIIRLSDIFNLDNCVMDLTSSQLLIVSGVNKDFALMVDDVLGIRDVVVKKMNDKLVQMKGISGATILSNGHVGLILDVNELFDFEKRNF